MRTIIIISILFFTPLIWAQNPLFEEYLGIDHRSISEFEDFKDYQDYGGMMIGDHDTEIQYGFAHYGKEGSQIITFETIRTVKSKGVYRIIDGLIISDLDSNQYLAYGICMLDGKDDSFIVVVYQSDELNEEDFTNIIKAWKANPEASRFETIETKSISCVNEGFGCAH
ncbi:MAG: hypothetical protein MK105_01380 [Crocinitomicaceae bacterium]|nr:hypothetical protein [Crocinitomicaceae bacterium]